MHVERPAETILREEEFAELLAPHVRALRSLLAGALTVDSAGWRKEWFADLLSESEELESFLDDHGARWNRRFAPLTELVGSLRSVAGACFHLAHVERRAMSYRFVENIGEPMRARWTEALQRAIAFGRRATSQLATTCVAHIARVEAATSNEAVKRRPAPGRIRGDTVASENQRKLPRTLHHAEPKDEEQKIAQVATDFLAICDLFRATADERHRRMAPGAWVRAQFDELRARTLTARVHNLQSAYDTYIGNTVLESRDPRLIQLRGHASFALHLLQAAVHLVHFRERYESEERAIHSEEMLSALVDPEELHAVVRDQLVLPAVECLLLGEPTARELVPSYTKVEQRRFRLPSDLAMHARPAALIVAVVNHHGTPVEMEVGSQTCNAASILEILMAIGTAPQVREFVFRGDERPLADLALLFDARLGEGGLASLPDGLAYLRR